MNKWYDDIENRPVNNNIDKSIINKVNAVRNFSGNSQYLGRTTIILAGAGFLSALIFKKNIILFTLLGGLIGSGINYIIENNKENENS